jgi:hypothetical protein
MCTYVYMYVCELVSECECVCVYTRMLKTDTAPQ